MEARYFGDRWGRRGTGFWISDFRRGSTDSTLEVSVSPPSDVLGGCLRAAKCFESEPNTIGWGFYTKS